MRVRTYEAVLGVGQVDRVVGDVIVLPSTHRLTDRPLLVTDVRVVSPEAVPDLVGVRVVLSASQPTEPHKLTAAWSLDMDQDTPSSGGIELSATGFPFLMPCPVYVSIVVEQPVASWAEVPWSLFLTGLEMGSG